MKTLYALHSIIAILFCANAHARIVLVEDSSPNEKIYMARVISKTPIIEKVPYMITKQICENQYQRIHYYGPDRTAPIVGTVPGPQHPVCKDVFTQQFHNVITGYRVTYDFKGTLKTAILNNEPSEFVQVYNAP
jgi:uncharacterized protein YcfJ